MDEDVAVAVAVVVVVTGGGASSIVPFFCILIFAGPEDIDTFTSSCTDASCVAARGSCDLQCILE
jgi:hypothetical protein